MELIGVLLGLAGIAAAIVIPLWIEYLKRPQLRIEWAADANNTIYGGPTRITHIKIINEPIRGWLGKWLLRNPANGCEVMLTFTSKSDGKKLGPYAAKWDARPEPIQWLPDAGGIHQFPDPEKIPACVVYDVSPGETGASLAVALKRDGEVEAWAFTALLYFSLPEDPLKAEGFDLAGDTDYEVMVRADAGGISREARLLLRNRGDLHTGLALGAEPIS
jgi:hypothetical protein